MGIGATAAFVSRSGAAWQISRIHLKLCVPVLRNMAGRLCRGDQPHHFARRAAGLSVRYRTGGPRQAAGILGQQLGLVGAWRSSMRQSLSPCKSWPPHEWQWATDTRLL